MIKAEQVFLHREKMEQPSPALLNLLSGWGSDSTSRRKENVTRNSALSGRQDSWKNLVTPEGRDRRKLIQHSDPSSAVSFTAGTKAPGIITPFQPLIQSVKLCTPICDMLRMSRSSDIRISDRAEKLARNDQGEGSKCCPWF
ncbi:uncharacterized [Tachysurus ichikawai]